MAEANIQQIIYEIESRGNKELLDGLVALQKESQELKKEKTDLNKILKEEGKLTDEQQKVLAKNTATVKTNQAQYRKLSKELQNHNKIADKNTTDYDKMQASMEVLNTELNRMTLAERESTDAGKLKTQQANELNEKLKELDGTVGKHQRNVGDYENSIKAASGSMAAMREELKEKQAQLDKLDMKSQEYKDLSNDVNSLTNEISVLSGEYDEFGNRAKKNPVAEEMATMADSAKGAMSSIALLNMALGDNEDAAMMQARAVQAMAIAQNAHNIAVGLSKVPQTAMILRTKAMAIGAGVATKAQFAWTTSIKLFSKAVYNIPVLGWLLAIVGAIGLGVVLLIKNWERVTSIFRKSNKDIEANAVALERAEESTKALRIETENLIRVEKELQDELSHEINIMKARGDSIEDIIQKQYQMYLSRRREQMQLIALQNAEIERLRIQMAGVKQNSKQHAEIMKELNEQIDIKNTTIDAVRGLDNAQEVANENYKRRIREQNKADTVRHTKKKEEVKEIADNTEEEELKAFHREQITQARIALMREESLENQIALIEAESLAKIETTELTASEIMLIEMQTNARIESLLEQRTAKYEAEKLRQREIDQEEAERKRIRDEEEKDREDELRKQRIQASFQYTTQLANNLENLAGENKRFAEFARSIALAETVFNIVNGLSKTAASLPFPANIPAILGFTAQTAGLVGQIRNVRMPSYAMGGDVWGTTIGGKSHGMGGTKFYGEDGTAFEAERNEGLYVVNKKDNPEAVKMLSEINSKSGRSFYAGTGRNFFKDGGSVMRTNPRMDFNSMDMAEVIRETVEQITQIPVVVSERDITSTQRTVRVLEQNGDLS